MEKCINLKLGGLLNTIVYIIYTVPILYKLSYPILTLTTCSLSYQLPHHYQSDQKSEEPSNIEKYYLFHANLSLGLTQRQKLDPAIIRPYFSLYFSPISFPIFSPLLHFTVFPRTHHIFLFCLPHLIPHFSLP